MAAAKRYGTRGQWALFFCSLLVALVLLEGGVRFRQWLRYGTTKGTFFEFSRDPETGLTIPTPGQKIGPIRIDSRGFRSPELEHPKPPRRLRLAFLGASTSFCAEVSSNEATWPYLVWQGLEERHPDHDFDFLNAAVAGYDVALSYENLRLRVAPLLPDLIVVYHAANDLAYDTRRLAIEQGLSEPDAGEPRGLARWSVAWFLIEKNLDLYLRRRAAGETLRLRWDPDETSRAFEARLVRLLELAQSTARVTAVATFSTKPRRGQPPHQLEKNAAISLYYMPYLSPRGVVEGFEAYNRAIRSAATRTGAVLIGDEDSIPPDDLHFNDSIHFRDAGSREMATRVLRALERAEAFRSLLERPP